MTDTLRHELSPFGVTVLTLMAGVVESKLFENQKDFSLREGSLFNPIESIIAKTASGEALP